jgi:diguanylate cyclase (GGDEF)-like protein
VATAADHEQQSMVEASRERLSSAMTPAEARATAVGTLGFLAAAAALAVLAPIERMPSPVWTVVLVLSFAVASRSEFEAGTGSAVPSQIAFVPMLFVFPAPLAPLLAAGGYMLAVIPDLARRRTHPARLLVPLSCCWYALGPAIVLTAAGQPAASFEVWPLLLAALAAQTGLDAMATMARERLVHGLHPREMVAPMAWVAAIDALLAPIALAAAVAARYEPAALIAIPALTGLLWLFATQWRAKIDQALELRDERAAKAGLERLSRTDALTGVLNRRGWDEELAAAVERARRLGEPLCLALIDIDHFKRFNDRHGHQAGDRLLTAAAAAWSGQIRVVDVLARYGGEEFAAALPHCELDAAVQVMERLRRASPMGVTCSVGLARWDGQEHSETLVKRADAALYRAKNEGRDRLVVAEDPAVADPA